MYEVRFPRINSNDTSYVLVEWLKEQGSFIRQGDPLASIETSKAVQDLEADADGFLHRIAVEGSEYQVGELVGIQFGTREEYQDFAGSSSDSDQREPAPDGGYVLSDAARELVRRYGLSSAALGGMKRTVIRARDIEAWLASPAKDGNPPPDHMTRHQSAVAAIVSQSHREIPSAFTAMRVYVDRAYEMSRQISHQRQVVIGLPEIMVRCIALARDRHPVLYAPGDHSGPGGRTDVGVTVDVGSGLFIPVVESADSKSLDEIAEVLMGFRKKAIRRRFSTSDLDGAGDIVLSLGHEPGVVVSQTIVFPGHIGMVSLGGTFEELFMEQGAVRIRRYVDIGLTYDHRYVNGRDAIEFLRTLKSGVEKPQRLDSPRAEPTQ